jgi:NADPH:quinone reductase-like Zn-dependent oxidoreductase
MGGSSFRRSFDLLGGTLVAYGLPPTRRHQQPCPPVPRVYAQLGFRNLQPNCRRALFYNLWGGSRITLARFRRHLADDLTSILTLLAEGAVTAHVAARIPLSEATRAMALAESRTVLGKVILVP